MNLCLLLCTSLLSSLLRSPHLDAPQCNDARLGLSSPPLNTPHLLRSSTRLCSSRRNAPPLATGPLLLRPGLEADTDSRCFRRSSTSAAAAAADRAALRAPHGRSDTAAKAPRAEPEPPLRARGSGLSRFRTVFGRSWTHLSRRVAVVHRFRCSCCERRRPWPQIVDLTQDLCDQRPHCHIGQLAHHAAAVAHDFWRRSPPARLVSGEFALELPRHMPMAASG